jgi:hypothetical protein
MRELGVTPSDYRDKFFAENAPALVPAAEAAAPM